MSLESLVNWIFKDLNGGKPFHYSVLCLLDLEIFQKSQVSGERNLFLVNRLDPNVKMIGLLDCFYRNLDG